MIAASALLLGLIFLLFNKYYYCVVQKRSFIIKIKLYYLGMIYYFGV